MKETYLGITIDRSKDNLLTDFSLSTLKDRYLLPEEDTPQKAFARAATTFCAGDLAFAQRIYDYVSNLWFMYSTPILSNGGTKKGLPISCFLSYVDDSRQGLNEHWAENTWLSSMGGGIGSYWGHIRSDEQATSNGSKSTGSIPFLKVVDSQMLAVSQGTTRRGAYAAYTDISHPEVEEFFLMRKPTGGDINRKCLNLHHAVNITDKFMEAVVDDLPWDLIDPHSKKVVKTVSARDLWISILTMRIETGEPFIHFIDTTNELRPFYHKKPEYYVHNSNLCTEIVLPTSKDRTAVCCLSSVNLEYFDEWKDTTMVRDLIRFLDNVLEYFIEHAPEGLDKAKYSAMRERSLGLGAMGLHAYLQKNNIAFASQEATNINKKMFEHISNEAQSESFLLAIDRGNAPDVEEWNRKNFQRDINSVFFRRNCYLMAIAPNASSGIITNSSPSIEPIVANVFNHKTKSGSFTVVNKYLLSLLQEKGLTEKEINKTIKSILQHKGSVQHLDNLTEQEKEVFKTAFEIDQMAIVNMAADRQEFIDQAQSVNLFFTSNVHKEVLNNTHITAWSKGLKTLYYCRSMADKRAEEVQTVIQNIVVEETPKVCGLDGNCTSCEG